MPTKKSVTSMVILFMVIVSSVLLVVMELISFYNMSLYEKNTRANYENSLQLYCSYWDNRMESIRSSLAYFSNDASGYYHGICEAEGLDYEISKVMMQRRLTEIAQSQNHMMLAFAWVPDRALDLLSSNAFSDYTAGERFREDIHTYIEARGPMNSPDWDYIESMGESYFVFVMRIGRGYVGAALRCVEILDGMAKNESVLSESTMSSDAVAQMALMDAKGNVLYHVRYKSGDQVSGGENFVLPLSNIKYQIQLTVTLETFGGQKNIFMFMIFMILVICILLFICNFLFQKRVVLGPLKRLKDAMEDFSGGNLEVRLPCDYSSTEIYTLYNTFNDMVTQISRLKVEVYEKELEKQKIQSDFLRVQIQPHFYANILNLIYGLAQVKDYGAIQKLSSNTAGYFRYLLGNKSTFAVLREEVACVKNYIEIQKMRYHDSLVFDLDIEESALGQPVLPMVLQTFVANCVKHNITMVPVLRVWVSIRISDEKLMMKICDNGVGINAQLLDKLKKHENISRNGERIGIQNVWERLCMFYKDQARMEISSVPSDTQITITLPAITVR